MKKRLGIVLGLAALAGAGWLWLRRSGGSGGASGLGTLLSGAPAAPLIDIGDIINSTTIAPTVQLPGDNRTLNFGGKVFTEYPQAADFSEYNGKGLAAASTGSLLLGEAQAAWRAKFGGP